MSYSWKFYSYKADADKVGEEIHSLGESFTLNQVVDKARDDDSEMHDLFEWDDSIAGEKYREVQAGEIVRNLVFTVPKDEPKTKAPVRVFVSANNNDKTYSSTTLVLRNEDGYQKLLNQALNELRAFKQKYATLKELDHILALIE